MAFIVAVFVISRLCVMAGIFFGRKFIQSPAGLSYPADSHWWDALVRWDAGRFLSIVTDGYAFVPDGQTYNISLFPFVPLSIRFFSGIMSVTPVVAGLLLSNLFFLCALLLLYRYTEECHREADAHLVVVLTAFFPLGVFYSSIYSESAFLFFSVLSFLMYSRGRYVLSAIGLLFLCTTRLAGLFVFAALAVSYLTNQVIVMKGKGRRIDRKALARFIAWALLSVSGFAAFLVYQEVALGYWDAFIRVQAGWNRHIGNFGGLLDELTSPDPFRIMNIIPAAVTLAISLRLLFLSAYRTHALWGILSVAIPLSTGSFISMTRLTMVFFPMLIYLASLMKGHPLLRDAGLSLSLSGLVILTSLFVRMYFLG